MEPDEFSDPVDDTVDETEATVTSPDDIATCAATGENPLDHVGDEVPDHNPFVVDETPTVGA